MMLRAPNMSMAKDFVPEQNTLSTAMIEPDGTYKSIVWQYTVISINEKYLFLDNRILHYRRIYPCNMHNA